MPESLADHAGLDPTEHAAILATVRAHHGLDGCSPTPSELREGAVVQGFAACVYKR